MGSKHPKKILFSFEKEITAGHPATAQEIGMSYVCIITSNTNDMYTLYIEELRMPDNDGAVIRMSQAVLSFQQICR